MKAKQNLPVIILTARDDLHREIANQQSRGKP